MTMGSDAAVHSHTEHGAQAGLLDRLRDYWALIKSRQTLLLLATGLAGYLSVRPGEVTPGTVLGLLASLCAAISGTTALNMWIDRDVDARMDRTASRPLPAGRLAAHEVALFGAALLALGVGIAGWMAWPFGLVIATGAFFDLAVYSLWLKRRSPLSILFGGISGGMPILAGRVLATGCVDVLGLLLAMSVLTWIPAHIMTLAMKYDRDYRSAAIPTWSNVYGFDAARRFIAFSNGLRVGTLVAAGWLLRICPYSLGLLGVSGGVMLGLSVWAMVRPSARLNHALFKFASVHMLGSMVLLTLGAMV